MMADLFYALDIFSRFYWRCCVLFCCFYHQFVVWLFFDFQLMRCSFVFRLFNVLLLLQLLVFFLQTHFRNVSKSIMSNKKNCVLCAWKRDSMNRTWSLACSVIFHFLEHFPHWNIPLSVVFVANSFLFWSENFAQLKDGNIYSMHFENILPINIYTNKNRNVTQLNKISEIFQNYVNT